MVIDITFSSSSIRNNWEYDDIDIITNNGGCIFFNTIDK